MRLNNFSLMAPTLLSLGTLIECILREFSDNLYRDVKTKTDVPNLTNDEANTVMEDGELHEEVIENMYLIQAYSDILQATELKSPQEEVRYNDEVSKFSLKTPFSSS